MKNLPDARKGSLRVRQDALIYVSFTVQEETEILLVDLGVQPPGSRKDRRLS